MSELDDINNKDINDLEYDDLIQYYAVDNNPVFLLGICMKLIEDNKAANNIYNDYINLRKDYVMFRDESTKIINDHSKFIQDQTDVINKLTGDHNRLLQFLAANNKSTLN